MYEIVDGPDRISAVHNGVEIVGARIRPGETVWTLYLTDRLTAEFHRCHPVVCSRDGARQWVEIIAALFAASATGRLTKPAHRRCAGSPSPPSRKPLRQNRSRHLTQNAHSLRTA